MCYQQLSCYQFQNHSHPYLMQGRGVVQNHLLPFALHVQDVSLLAAQVVQLAGHFSILLSSVLLDVTSL